MITTVLLQIGQKDKTFEKPALKLLKLKAILLAHSLSNCFLHRVFSWQGNFFGHFSYIKHVIYPSCVVLISGNFVRPGCSGQTPEICVGWKPNWCWDHTKPLTSPFSHSSAKHFHCCRFFWHPSNNGEQYSDMPAKVCYNDKDILFHKDNSIKIVKNNVHSCNILFQISCLALSFQQVRNNMINPHHCYWQIALFSYSFGTLVSRGRNSIHRKLKWIDYLI